MAFDMRGDGFEHTENDDFKIMQMFADADDEDTIIGIHSYRDTDGEYHLKVISSGPGLGSAGMHELFATLLRFIKANPQVFDD